MLSSKLLLIYIAVLIFENSAQDRSTSCKGIQTCNGCVQTNSCIWCLDPAYKQARCFNNNNSTTQECKNTYDARNVQTIVDNVSLTKAKKGGKIVQLQPQKIKVNLRKDTTERIRIKYSRAEGYPIDLYYLMDFSKSMEDDKAKIKDLGQDLARSLKNVTEHFNIGFGSFVDKPVAPYISIHPVKIKTPCTGCVPAYSFKNHMSLTSKVDEFAKTVEETKISGNLDPAEGGFDALIQVIDCIEIGWREQARRIIVFATDDTFHSAGDGKLAGIFAPNDGKCHLTDNSYTHAALQDYPSISQINQKAKEKKISIIFAVTQDHIEVYKKLSERIESSVSEVLNDDSSNIAKLVMKKYNAMSSSIEIKDTSSDDITVTYYSKCNGPDLKETNKCDSLKIGNEIEFEMDITLNRCIEDNKLNFTVYAVGVAQEHILIEIEPICKCPCEKNPEKNSEACKKRGNLVCGLCVCSQDFSGAACECEADKDKGSNSDKCKAPNSKDICSNRGDCDCGICKCTASDKYSGDFCECDNQSCNRVNNLLCGGPDHGECKCGECNCKSDWTGPFCNCKPMHNCRDPTSKNDVDCSGNGNCDCGICKCKTDAQGSYTGKYCEFCPKCPKRCDEFKQCVLCKTHKKGNCPSECIHEIEEVDNFNDIILENKCIRYVNECRFEFAYTEDKDQIKITAEKSLICFGKVYEYGIYSTVGIILGIVLIGLGTLIIWKVITKIHDKREFDLFMKNAREAKKKLVANDIFDETNVDDKAKK